MKKASFAKKSGMAKKGAMSSTLYEPKSGANRKSSAQRLQLMLKTDLTAGRSKTSRQFLRGRDVNELLNTKKVKKTAAKKRKLKYGY